MMEVGGDEGGNEGDDIVGMDVADDDVVVASEALDRPCYIVAGIAAAAGVAGGVVYLKLLIIY